MGHAKLDQILVGLNLILPVPGDQHVNHQHGPLQLDTGLAGDSLGREQLQLNDLHDQQHINRQHLPLQCDSLVPDSLGEHQLNDIHDQRVNLQHLPLKCDANLVRDSLGEPQCQLNDLHDQHIHLSHLPLQCDTSLVRDSLGMFPSGAAIDLQQLDDFPDQHVNHNHLPMQYDMIDTSSAATQTLSVELHEVATQAMDVLVLDP